jgi:hypothetical protein
MFCELDSVEILMYFKGHCEFCTIWKDMVTQSTMAAFARCKIGGHFPAHGCIPVISDSPPAWLEQQSSHSRGFSEACPLPVLFHPAFALIPEVGIPLLLDLPNFQFQVQVGDWYHRCNSTDSVRAATPH